MQHIFLIGFMGVGKTTVSRKLQQLVQLDEIDMDATIVKENGMSISDMFEQFGEAYFREKETELLLRLAGYAPAVVSCGGGCVLRKENVEAMKACGTIVLLTATPQTVFRRVRYGKSRPILNGNMNVEFISELMEKRRSAYEGACDVVVSTDGKRPEEIAREILEQLKK